MTPSMTQKEIKRELAPLIKRIEALEAGQPQGPSDRERIAKTIYAGWLDADFCTENHFQWFDAGKDNPDSCVHYSNVAKAFKVADLVLSLPRSENKP